MKKICLFCGEEHKRRRPALCVAKGDIIREYVKAGVQYWQVMAGIERGIIKLEAEAYLLVAKRREKSIIAEINKRGA